MKIVEYYKWVGDGIGGNNKVSEGKAIFHGFGVAYKEFETGPGNYSTAIIELHDGTVKNIPVEMVKFVKDMTLEEFHNAN